MKSQVKNNTIAETPHDMMNRIFAVAELIVQSTGYNQDETKESATMEKHGSENSVYRKQHTYSLGNTNGSEET